MSKKVVLIVAVVYAIVGLILNNVLQTAVGGYMMTLSLLAFVVAFIGVLYYILKFNIKWFRFKQNQRNH